MFQKAAGKQWRLVWEHELAVNDNRSAIATV
jgi:hypothetical protein